MAVTIEGASALETPAVNGALGGSNSGSQAVDAGEELIDVGLYFGAEDRRAASSVRYVQLKHSTRRAQDAWTASGLEKTVSGFAKRYAELVAETSAVDVAKRFGFEFTTNRPIAADLAEALSDLAAGTTPRHPKVQATLVTFTGLPQASAVEFFRLFVAEGGEGDLWTQRNLLSQDLRSFLPDADYDAPVQLKELVARKATSEFTKDPSIRRYDVLRVLKSSEDDLQPAPNLIPLPSAFLPRDQEDEICSPTRSYGPVMARC